MRQDHKTQIVIAVIGLVGVIAGGMFANWDKIFPPRSNEPIAKNKQQALPAMNTTISPPAPQKENPVFQIVWKKKDSLDRPYSEVFSHTSENRHNIGAKNTGGIYKLSNADGRIYDISFKHVGEFCGWNYNPNGGYSKNVEIIEGGRSFRWARRWDGKPCTEIYEAFYEIPEKVCIKNCD